MLDELELTIDPGETLAVVGESGAGKSTLAALLLGLAQPTAGSIEVGGVDLADCRLDQWRSLLAWVPQRPTIFRGTVADNIRLGRPDATDAEVRAAAVRSGADAFTGRLADGYDTLVGDGGRVLSAGERRRIALARALVRDAALIVLDEPTADLDPESAALVARAIEELHGAVTILLDRPPPGARRPGRQSRPAFRRQGARATPAGGRMTGRVLALTRAPRGRLALAAGLGAFTVCCGIGLMATAGYLISRAAERPAILSLTAAIVGVRFFGLARPLARYLERLASHDVAFRVLGRVRVRVFQRIEPLAPTQLDCYRRGDLLSRFVADVDALQDIQLRGTIPILAALGAGTVAVAVAAAVLPAAAVVLCAGLLVGGIAVPAAPALSAGAPRGSRPERAESCRPSSSS